MECVYHWPRHVRCVRRIARIDSQVLTQWLWLLYALEDLLRDISLACPWNPLIRICCWASVLCDSSIYSLEPTAERHWHRSVWSTWNFEPAISQAWLPCPHLSLDNDDGLWPLVKTKHANQGYKTVSGSRTSNKMYENLRFCSLLILGFSHFKSNHEPLYHIHTHQSVHPFESPFSCLEFGPLTLTLETQAQPANQVLLHQLYKETQ